MESLTLPLHAATPAPADAPAPRRREDPPVLEHPRLPAAARRAVSDLFLLTLLSAVDGSVLVLAAQGQLGSLGGAVTVGLTVIAGAGSWLAAHRAFAGRPLRPSDGRALAALGALSLGATLVAAWLGVRLGDALTLHVLPKAAGVVLFLVAVEVAGFRLPRLARLPLPVAALGAGALLEVAAQWAP